MHVSRIDSANFVMHVHLRWHTGESMTHEVNKSIEAMAIIEADERGGYWLARAFPARLGGDDEGGWRSKSLEACPRRPEGA